MRPFLHGLDGLGQLDHGRAGRYVKSPLTASIPACAHCSSWSDVPPLTPIPPICTLFAVMMGRPPANVTMPGKLAMPGTMPGFPSLPKGISLNGGVEKGNLAEVIALCWA